MRIDGVAKEFGELRVLDGIDLDVQRGEVVAIIGASGSGKSTLLRCISLLEQIDAGTISLQDQVIASGGQPISNNQATARLRARIGMVFQNFNLFPHYSALHNVAVGLIHVLKKPRSQAYAEARDLLATVGLSEKAEAYPARLSGGQQQRVAIARALAMKPEVMLFDEATSALDPELVGEVLGVMRQVAAQGMTMIVVTHEMSFARDVADRVVFIDAGRIVEQGPPARVLDQPSSERLIRFLKNTR